MQSKTSPSAQPSPPAIAKPGTSPIHTPAVNDIGDGSTAYKAETKEPSDFEDLEGRGYLRRGESELDTSVGPDVEMRNAADPASDAKAARNRRLTLLQLERFRRAIAVNKARNARRNSSSWWEAKARRGEGFDSIFAENPDGSPGPMRELRIVVYPWAMWVLGCLLIIAASIFVDHIHQQALKKRRLVVPETTVNWWKYLVAGIIYICAALVIGNARVETFSMNKETCTLSVCSSKPLCPLPRLRRTRIVQRELRQIVDVRVEASGEILSGEVDTRAYKVHFDFDDGTHTTTLEGRSKTKAVVRCRLIKQFLLSCAPPASTVASSPLSGSGSTSGSDNASPQAGMSIVLPARSASSNLTLAVPAPLTMPAAAAGSVAPSPRRVMMVAAVPSTLSQKSSGVSSK